MEDLKRKFEEDGFVKIPQSMFSLDTSTVETLRTEFDKLFAGQYDTGIYPDEIHWRDGISKDNATRELCNAWKASGIIQQIVTSEILGSIACTLMNWDCCRLGQDDIIYKPPNSNPVGFHCDGVYISDNFVPRDNNCLTMWIALDDADSENGALQYAPGSHLWQSTNKQNSNSNDNEVSKDVTGSSFHVVSNNDDGNNETDNDYLTPVRKAAEKAGRSIKNVEDSIVTIDVPAGELLIHHQSTWHGSGPNISTTRTRRSLVAHLINGEVQWRTTSKPHYIYGRYYIRGEHIPREDFFPVTYAKNDYNERQRSAWLDE